MLLKAVLTDLDGVLLDSFREGLRKIQYICAIHDIPFGRDTRTRLFDKWGIPGAELLSYGLDINMALAERMYAAWEKFDKVSPPPLIPGAREVLVWLRKNGFKTALITSRNRENLMEVLDQIDVSREFTVITAKGDCPYHKPDPRVFRFALEHLQEQGVEKGNCVFIGDTPSDTVAGRAAEIETLVVQTGPYMIEHVEQYPMKLQNVLKSIDDLPFWIEKHHDGELNKLYL